MKVILWPCNRLMLHRGVVSWSAEPCEQLRKPCEICCKFAGKISRGLSFQWSLTCRVYLSLYIYLDPPFGYHIPGVRKVCFFGVFFGAHISHPTEGFRYIHPPAFERESTFWGEIIFQYHPCMVYVPTFTIFYH